MTYPPGPRGRQSLGFFGRGQFSSPLAFLENVAQSYGPLAYFRLLHQHTYLAAGPDFVKEVLINQQHSVQRDFGATILRELVGDSVITREEPLHKERRRVLQPAFHREQIASYVTTIAGEAARLADEWSRTVCWNGFPIDIGAAMRAATLSVIGTILFGEEFRSSAERISAVLADVVVRAKRIAPFATVMKVITRRYRDAWPNGPSLYFQKQRAELDRILQPLIELRQRVDGRDVLSLLLAMHDKGDGSLSQIDVRNEMVTFVLAGHETTATALTWCLYLLAKHTDVQDGARREVQEVCGERPPVFDDLARLTYTSAVFQETLRLYPPVPLFGRRVTEPLQLDRFDIPRGATVLLSPYITHRSETNFERATQFDPDRWTRGEQGHKFAFFPFGGGAKMCIGDVFAKTEGKVILATLLQRCRFELTSDAVPEIDPRVTLKPKEPIQLRVRDLKPNLTFATESGLLRSSC